MQISDREQDLIIAALSGVASHLATPKAMEDFGKGVLVTLKPDGFRVVQCQDGKEYTLTLTTQTVGM